MADFFDRRSLKHYDYRNQVFMKFDHASKMFSYFPPRYLENVEDGILRDDIFEDMAHFVFHYINAGGDPDYKLDERRVVDHPNIPYFIIDHVKSFEKGDIPHNGYVHLEKLINALDIFFWKYFLNGTLREYSTIMKKDFRYRPERFIDAIRDSQPSYYADAIGDELTLGERSKMGIPVTFAKEMYHRTNDIKYLLPVIVDLYALYGDTFYSSVEGILKHPIMIPRDLIRAHYLRKWKFNASGYAGDDEVPNNSDYLEPSNDTEKPDALDLPPVMDLKGSVTPPKPKKRKFEKPVVKSAKVRYRLGKIFG